MNVWNSKIKNDMQAFFQKAENTFNTNIPILQNTSDNVVLQIPGAQERHNRAQNAIENNVGIMKRSANSMREIIKKIDHSTIIWKINKVKQQLEGQNNILKEKQVIVNLRKEQTEALDKKESANLHSSWIGLWRPLSETGRTTLFILSIVFSLLFLTVGVYLFSNLAMKGGQINTSSTLPTSMNRNVLNLFGGGSFFKRSSK
jgi:hypothetical protein